MVFAYIARFDGCAGLKMCTFTKKHTHRNRQIHRRIAPKDKM
jgi:hypothetical protein